MSSAKVSDHSFRTFKGLNLEVNFKLVMFNKTLFIWNMFIFVDADSGFGFGKENI